jgi:Mn-dependent DtxR family transcriptional regulator
MALQGTQLDVLQTIADLQETNPFEEIEDVQIAEELELEVGVVKSLLNTLADKGYVRLEKLDTLVGVGYNASLTSQGEAALEEVYQ